MCLNCSEFWYCDEEFGCECGKPAESSNDCACGCHRFWNDDPAIAVPERHKRYGTYLTKQQQEWARANFTCTRHVFKHHHESIDGKYTGRHVYDPCPYCGAEAMLCPKCNYKPLNSTPGAPLDKCIMNTCKETA